MAWFAHMTCLRWFALALFVVSFAATFTSFYEEHHYLWLSLWAVGMLCLVLSWRRERT
jgi:general stress protein CsbA